ncbi:MAG: radical SAM protein [Caulobacteraceae bacterium]
MAIAEGLGKLGVTWSCNAKANVPRRSLEKFKRNGLRLLLVGYESGDQQILFNIKKGMRVEVAERFTRDCHDLGIKIHGTFIAGLPGEDPGNHPADHRLGLPHQSAHHPGVAGRALSGHAPV